ncbi:hypothetical protein K493DRAFT_345947 [Basidiobolus meristosporus CBS 931.73]|uniref:Uncharacterized protein n=1 Tax=Basidiobolus meristosporus CBS 931.73 TaxID=1314790 RepID=A0A1Y1Z0F2_9FUNG|nr:hypothetical protein K493DRAFT_345947 [Basidiobolus meristosporus CBS 931.73]|eukprot:ORY03772.1 hypothetical protein K493DRAFT_345947 [Basidiobolus meristosporus CBS 931.73]
MQFNRKKSVEIAVTRRILMCLLGGEQIIGVFLLYFDLAVPALERPYISIVTNILTIGMCGLDMYGSLRYIKRILLLYSVWCVLFTLWIVFCALTSLSVIHVSSYTQDIAQMDEHLFISIPIQYAHALVWNLHISIKVSLLTSLSLIYVSMLILAVSGRVCSFTAPQTKVTSLSHQIATAVLSIIVRRAYLMEQRLWDDLDNQVLARYSGLYP